MISESELRSKMAEAVQGGLSLNRLYDWLMNRSWNMHQDSNPSAVALAGDLEAVLLERSDGDASDSEALRQIAQLLTAGGRAAKREG